MNLNDYLENIQYEISERRAIMLENNATLEQISQEKQARRREYIATLRNVYRLSLSDAAKQVMDVERQASPSIDRRFY